MRALALPVSGDPGRVWRVGYEPDPWVWTPWQYADDDGRFNGRWDDQRAAFRTLYTSNTLLGCFLELLAKLRPNDVAYAELDGIEDDAPAGRPTTGDPERGAIGMEWLSGRVYGQADQTGTYAEVTTAAALSHFDRAGVFAKLGIPAWDVDVALLKDSNRRDVTRSVARYVYDLLNADRQPLVDGIAFRSRMGDDLLLWAVFEREDRDVSEHITATSSQFPRVAEDLPDLVNAFELLGLHWREE